MKRYSHFVWCSILDRAWAIFKRCCQSWTYLKNSICCSLNRCKRSWDLDVTNYLLSFSGRPNQDFLVRPNGTRTRTAGSKINLSNYHFLIKKVFHSTKMELSSFVSFEVLISTYWAFYDIELKRRSRQATISFLSSSALFPLFVPNSICGRHFFFAAQNSTATPFLHTSQDFPDAFLA